MINFRILWVSVYFFFYSNPHTQHVSNIFPSIEKINYTPRIFLYLATIVSSTAAPSSDLKITGSNTYRPSILTEKLFTDEWAKKISPTHNQPKESLVNNQQTGSLFFSLPLNHFLSEDQQS